MLTRMMKSVAKRLGTIVLVTLTTSLFYSHHLMAGEADIISAKIFPLGDSTYRIDATVAHQDTGWDHYADRWDVLDESGNLIGSRVLAHPHVNEQPFTRSLTVTIPAGVAIITLRAHDSVHGLGGMTYEIQVPEATQ